MVRCFELFSGLFLYKRSQLLQQRLKRTILDFSECWIGPPTQSMLRARATGRTYVRANGADAEGEIEEA